MVVVVFLGDGVLLVVVVLLIVIVEVVAELHTFGC